MGGSTPPSHSAPHCSLNLSLLFVEVGCLDQQMPALATEHFNIAVSIGHRRLLMYQIILNLFIYHFNIQYDKLDI